MDDNIELKKQISKYLRESEENSKQEKCPICGQKQTSYCNSHVIPQFVLKNITKDGKLYHPNVLLELEVLDMEKGIKNAGTFHYICHHCDNTYFSNYECEKALQSPPTNIMMAEIALKNSLLQMSKRQKEKVLYEIIQREFSSIINKSVIDKINIHDMSNYAFSIKRSKKIIDKNLKSGFHLLFYYKLPYVSPIAIQTSITVEKDLNGKVLNDVTNYSSRMEDLNLCIFPLKTETATILFYHKDDRKYVRFEKQFNRLNLPQKLQFINYLVFKYTENYFISKTVSTSIINNNKLKELSQSVYDTPNLGFVSFEDYIKPNPLHISPEEIPNFLSEENKIKSI